MLDEFELIEAIRERVERAGASAPSSRVVVGSGDDAAVSLADGATVISVDALVEGVDFRLETFAPEDIGHKALAAALSDLAAMGAEPGEAYVQLGIPEGFAEDDCLELAGGLGDLAAAWGVTVAGGDLSRAPALLLAVTVVGHLDDPDSAVRRSGARPGDVVCVTGELGGAAAGLILLERPELAERLDPAPAERLRERQLRPTPRLAAGRALAARGASAMIDISDGLGADAGHLADAGGVRVEIELARVPVAEGVGAVAEASGADALDLATASGEDYELLAALPAGRVDEAIAAVGATGLPLSAIGAVAEGKGAALRDASGAQREPRGFDQLAGGAG